MTGKIYDLKEKSVFIDTIINSFLSGLRSNNLGTESTRWILQGLKDLEKDPVIASLLVNPKRLNIDSIIKDQCYQVITPEKIEEYFKIDDPSNI
ncbi:MAG TPA: hypothetical protein VLH94_03825 [Spirochaetia bacterium]|nr:hypothetical protein [Spirochaetia bacterium]